MMYQNKLRSQSRESSGKARGGSSSTTSSSGSLTVQQVKEDASTDV
ncbi:MAG: hypothetical protein ACYCQJ_12810 [Nitrososphaerales archaeon]